MTEIVARSIDPVETRTPPASSTGEYVKGLRMAAIFIVEPADREFPSPALRVKRRLRNSSTHKLGPGTAPFGIRERSLYPTATFSPPETCPEHCLSGGRPCPTDEKGTDDVEIVDT